MTRVATNETVKRKNMSNALPSSTLCEAEPATKYPTRSTCQRSYQTRALASTLLVLLISNVALAQSVEISGGLNFSSFPSDRTPSSSNAYTNNNGGRGISFGLSYTGFKKFKNNVRVSLLVDQYEGEVSAGDWGTSYRDYLNVSFKKTTIAAAIYPFNFNLTPNTFFAFGLELNYLIDHQTSGSYIGSRYQSPPAKETYDNESNIHSTVCAGASLRLHHEFRITDKWSISPQYKLFAGITPDLAARQNYFFAIRHSALLGVTMKLT